MFYVYEHVRNDTNEIFYVGKGKGRRATAGWSRNKHWINIVNKANGFTVNFVAKGLDEELAFLAEIERIDQLRRLGVKLCNIAPGGEGNTMKGEEHPLYGKHHSAETKAKIGRAASKRIGDKNAFFGKTHTEESKAKMSEARKAATTETTRKLISESAKTRTGNKNSMFGRKHSEETKAKIREKRLAYNTRIRNNHE